MKYLEKPKNPEKTPFFIEKYENYTCLSSLIYLNISP